MQTKLFNNLKMTRKKQKKRKWLKLIRRYLMFKNKQSRKLKRLRMKLHKRFKLLRFQLQLRQRDWNKNLKMLRFVLIRGKKKMPKWFFKRKMNGLKRLRKIDRKEKNMWRKLKKCILKWLKRKRRKTVKLFKKQKIGQKRKLMMPLTSSMKRN